MNKLKIEIEIETNGNEADIECDLLEHFIRDDHDTNVEAILVEDAEL